MSSTQVCLVMTEEAVMAQDIALTLSDRFGGVRILLAKTPAEALAQLAPVDRVLVAVADLTPEEVASSPLAHAVTSRNGKVVLITDTEHIEENLVLPFTLLDRPFQSRTLLDVLPPPGAE